MKKFNEIHPKENQICYVVSSGNGKGDLHFFESYQDALDYRDTKHPLWRNVYRCIVRYEGSLIIVSSVK